MNDGWSPCVLYLFFPTRQSVLSQQLFPKAAKIPGVTSLNVMWSLMSWWWTRQSTFITLHVDFMLCTFMSSQYLFAIQCFRWSFIGNILAYSYLLTQVSKTVNSVIIFILILSVYKLSIFSVLHFNTSGYSVYTHFYCHTVYPQYSERCIYLNLKLMNTWKTMLVSLSII